MLKRTLVLGASANPMRYAFMAINRLRSAGIEVVALGKKKESVRDVEILTDASQVHPPIHTVTIYLNPLHQAPFYDLVISLRPERVIFNPGAENDAFAELLSKHNIHFENACTLVLLSTGQY